MALSGPSSLVELRYFWPLPLSDRTLNPELVGHLNEAHRMDPDTLGTG